MEQLPQDGNLFSGLDKQTDGELFQALFEGREFRVERIVSTGQATPEGQWYDQVQAEWVVLLSGAAELRFEGEPAPRRLSPGDYVQITAGRRHRVESTDPEQATVWLAIHYTPGDTTSSPA